MLDDVFLFKNHAEALRRKRIKDRRYEPSVSVQAYIETRIVPGNIIGKIKASARPRNIDVDLTKRYLEDLLVAQNFKCALSGYNISFFDLGSLKPSLDRKDSKKGYIVGNVQWVTIGLNVSKRDQSDDEFIAMCRAVVAHQDREKDPTCIPAKGL